MSKTSLLNIALIIMLVPFFLISIGTTEETSSLWWIGLICLVIGGIIPPVTRYAFGESDEKE
ncbi:MAG: hypothetical protein WD604_02950 [Balneolaceae bacterium]